MRGIRRRKHRPSRRARLAAASALVAGVVMFHGAASAQIPLPELPLPTSTPLVEDTLSLEDLLNVDELFNDGELPVSTDLDETLGTVTDTLSGVLGTTTDPADPAKPVPPPATTTTVGSWATDSTSTLRGLHEAATRVSSTSVPSVSYGAAVGDGFARAGRRAAELAGPVAAPMILALFAVGLLFVAARGPGRLVKIEEERKAFRDQRTFRL